MSTPNLPWRESFRFPHIVNPYVIIFVPQCHSGDYTGWPHLLQLQTCQALAPFCDLQAIASQLCWPVAGDPQSHILPIMPAFPSSLAQSQVRLLCCDGLRGECFGSFERNPHKLSKNS